MKHSQEKALLQMGLAPDTLHLDAVKAFFAFTDKGEVELAEQLPKNSQKEKDFCKMRDAFRLRGLCAKEWAEDFRGRVEVGYWPLLWPQDFDGEPFYIKQHAMRVYKGLNGWLPRVWCPLLRYYLQKVLWFGEVTYGN